MPQSKSDVDDSIGIFVGPPSSLLSPSNPSAARRIIPIHPVTQSDALDECAGAESFALMVLGDSMEPEFVEGDIVVIEPDGLALDGSYVLAWVGDEWIFRQLQADGGAWRLCPLNAAYPTLPLSDLAAVRGIVIQKSKPGRRRASKRYVA